ncbi:uncharacterized protein N7484_001456 [Penicillium longicatenatum]|uniref:uncharacterized protein n=1 Tax=Penicillium longicatenatum TaxID=1561947 RepID=UPI002548B386|nr:uncharacterized protein N7484_001456 [Penicillium longicatenatum]KAJ5657807.1 hypothetical protein N7484_001456 [Penicillium longicatenatum]
MDDWIYKVLDKMGFIYTFTVLYSLEMNGLGKCSRGVLTLRARALIKEGKLLDKLWPKAIAIVFVDKLELPKTLLANVCLYGSLIYYWNPTIP